MCQMRGATRVYHILKKSDKENPKCGTIWREEPLQWAYVEKEKIFGYDRTNKYHHLIFNCLNHAIAYKRLEAFHPIMRNKSSIVEMIQQRDSRLWFMGSAVHNILSSHHHPGNWNRVSGVPPAQFPRLPAPRSHSHSPPHPPLLRKAVRGGSVGRSQKESTVDSSNSIPYVIIRNGDRLRRRQC